MTKSCTCCGAIWGLEEIDWQKCDACGWTPDQDPDIYVDEHPEHFGSDEEEEPEFSCIYPRCSCFEMCEWISEEQEEQRNREEYYETHGTCEVCGADYWDGGTNCTCDEEEE